VVCGLALTIFGTGLSGFLGKSYQGTPISDPFRAIHIPGLADIPVLGRIFFQQDALVYLSIVIAVLMWLVLYHSRWGLSIRSVGQILPRLMQSASVSAGCVIFVRSSGVFWRVWAGPIYRWPMRLPGRKT
jgi:simple sugar transport system permease protein